MSVSAAFLLSFLTGAIPTSFILVKMRTGQDIRRLGSGNAGATNVYRSVGKKEGLAVLAADIAKGLIAVTLFTPWIEATGWEATTQRFVVGLAAIFGHVFSPFLGFKGGKGVATSAGVGLAVYPVPLAIALAVWAIVLMRWRIVSVASITAAYVFAVCCFIFVASPVHCAIAIAAAVFITWTHRVNISRLRKGEEPEFISGKKGP